VEVADNTGTNHLIIWEASGWNINDQVWDKSKRQIMALSRTIAVSDVTFNNVEMAWSERNYNGSTGRAVITHSRNATNIIYKNLKIHDCGRDCWDVFDGTLTNTNIDTGTIFDTVEIYNAFNHPLL